MHKKVGWKRSEKQLEALLTWADFDGLVARFSLALSVNRRLKPYTREEQDKLLTFPSCLKNFHHPYRTVRGSKVDLVAQSPKTYDKQNVEEKKTTWKNVATKQNSHASKFTETNIECWNNSLKNLDQWFPNFFLGWRPLSQLQFFLGWFSSGCIEVQSNWNMIRLV